MFLNRMLLKQTNLNINLIKNISKHSKMITLVDYIDAMLYTLKLFLNNVTGIGYIQVVSEQCHWNGKHHYIPQRRNDWSKYWLLAFFQ